ncbi:hypothetical protein PV755_45775, partial [Streptomyces caniscabiei]|nr:hypothetical protein [Streptomyces caniscabiei]
MAVIPGGGRSHAPSACGVCRGGGCWLRVLRERDPGREPVGPGDGGGCPVFLFLRPVFGGFVGPAPGGGAVGRGGTVGRGGVVGRGGGGAVGGVGVGPVGFLRLTFGRDGGGAAGGVVGGVFGAFVRLTFGPAGAVDAGPAGAADAFFLARVSTGEAKLLRRFSSRFPAPSSSDCPRV